MLVCGFAEQSDHCGGVDVVMGANAERVTGAVVEERQDLGDGVVGEPPVAHIGLPHLVG